MHRPNAAQLGWSEPPPWTSSSSAATAPTAGTLSSAWSALFREELRVTGDQYASRRRAGSHCSFMLLWRRESLRAMGLKFMISL